VTELAARADVSIQWLQGIRHGGRQLYGEWRLPNPKDEALARLAKALNVPIEEMFTRAGRPGTEPPAEQDARRPEGEAASRIDDHGAAEAIRELQERVEQHEQELAELRQLLERRQRRASGADSR